MSRWEAPHSRTDAAKGGNVLLPCPTCGRTTHADKLVDLSSLGPDTMQGWLVQDKVCDACRSRLHRKGVVDRATFIELLGAPTEQVQRARAKLSQESNE